MRLAPALALPAALVLAHCNPVDISAPGTHTAAVPPTPDAAWVVNLASNGAACSLQASTRSLGEVNAMFIATSVTDQQVVMGQTASIVCSVAPVTGGFAVNARASLGVDSLGIVIPKIDTSATPAAPAIGSVTYVSDATVTTYSGGMCHFYYASGSDPSAGKGGVGSGKVWVAFTCDGLADSSTPPSSCPVTESFAVFEDCSSTPSL